MKPLAELIEAVDGARWLHPPRGEVRVGRIVRDSRQAAPGDLFVAIPGTRVDGHDHLADAVRRGAVAAVVEREVTGVGVPLLRVPNARRALAELAAAWYDHPAERLPLVGITGTLGKTSVLAMLESILTRTGRQVGVIGSLGIQFGDEVDDTGHTVPGPLTVQRALAGMAEAGADLAAMEVTSHALVQDRVHGLRFALGIFTNLVPLEHMEYHGSFADYAQAKARYFEHLPPGTPLIFAAGDRVVRALVEEHDVRPVGCGAGSDAELQVEQESVGAEGMALRVRIRRPLPALGGGSVAPTEFALHLKLLGRSNANNAALATAAALCLGASVEAVREALEEQEAPRRRMQIIERGRFTVLDDTVGHPDSITAVFEVAEALPHRQLHVVFAIRGQRGPDVNRGDADALAIWAERVPVASLAVTRSEDAADERNRVAPEEREAFVGRLREAGMEFREHDRLDDTLARVLDRVEDGDLLLLLGAQGMDAGAEMLRRLLARGQAA
jgi:UDP-N-acetylmuramoyl-L-alanyl-D-glutamate--2,6-diaminopimelate ligase